MCKKSVNSFLCDVIRCRLDPVESEVAVCFNFAQEAGTRTSNAVVIRYGEVQQKLAERGCQEGCVNGVNHHDCNLPAAAQQRADCAQLGSLPSNRIAS